MEERKNKILSLEIDVVEPQYDSEGEQIHNTEREDEDTPPHLDQIFNAHLLDEEYMNEQPYVGERFSSDSDDSQRQQAKQPPPEYKPLEGEELE